MAAEARERHRLLEVANAERVKHKEERRKMLEQIESLMHQVNESEVCRRLEPPALVLFPSYLLVMLVRNINIVDGRESAN